MRTRRRARSNKYWHSEFTWTIRRARTGPCAFCQAKGRDRGYDPQRAIKGYQALYDWYERATYGGPDRRPSPAPLDQAEAALAVQTAHASHEIVGRPIDREALLSAVLAQLAPRVDQWQEGRPELVAGHHDKCPVVVATHPLIGTRYLYCDQSHQLLFCDNETNRYILREQLRA